LEFFKRLKERVDDVVVSTKELCPFRIVNGSHGPHDVTYACIADTTKDLETAEWETYIGLCSSAGMLGLELDCFSVIKLMKPILFDVVASE
jgi:hypothetical protein